MGEASQKSKSHKSIVSAADRCIYCSNYPSSVEHMPPRSMFLGRIRPSGLEFAACEPCNNGTKGADIVAGIFSRISPDEDLTSAPLTLEIKKLLHALDRDAPGVREEVFDESNAKFQWFRRQSGAIVPRVVVRSESPLLKAHLAVFAAKMGMALYREHIGVPLPLEGAVYVQYFLNNGLTQQHARALLSILPTYNTLKQGLNSASSQFGYKYNSDDESVIAALATFHSNMHIFAIATSVPEIYEQAFNQFHHGDLIRPGELLLRLSNLRN